MTRKKPKSVNASMILMVDSHVFTAAEESVLRGSAGIVLGISVNMLLREATLIAVTVVNTSEDWKGASFVVTIKLTAW
jgi:hypothetical protein